MLGATSSRRTIPPTPCATALRRDPDSARDETRAQEGEKQLRPEVCDELQGPEPLTDHTRHSKHECQPSGSGDEPAD